MRQRRRLQALVIASGLDNPRGLARAGLVTPGGVAIGRNGAYYVTSKSTLVDQGEVLRIRPPH
jgi:hypothetical protein